MKIKETFLINSSCLTYDDAAAPENRQKRVR